MTSHGVSGSGTDVRFIEIDDSDTVDDGDAEFYSVQVAFLAIT